MFVADNADYVVTLLDQSFGGIESDTGIRYHIDPIEGWGPTGSTRSGTRRQGASGSWSGKGFSKSRTVAISGRLLGPSTEALRAAFDETIVPNVPLDDFPLRVLEGAAERWTPVHRTGDILEKWKSDRWLEWSIQVESDDWRKFGAEQTKQTKLPITSGGFVYPHGYPYSIPAVTVTGVISLTNRGNETGPVRLRIDGPVKGPVVTHRAGGAWRELTFASSLELGVGEWVEVLMEDHEVLANGQVSRQGWVTQRQWSGFEPGINSWSFNAVAYSAAASLTVYATDSWQ